MTAQPDLPAGEPAHILVIDDDTRLLDLLHRFLGEQGYGVTTAADAGRARAYLAALAFDALVVDIMLPDEDGLSLLQGLRTAGDRTPVLMLTARNEPETRIAGLETGADDYLAKPFEPRELLLRLTALVRRHGGGEAADGTAPVGHVVLGPMAFDPGRGELWRGETPVPLTDREARLLAALARADGQPVTRQDLAELGGERTSERAVDVQVARLRRKLGDDPRQPHFLQTVRGQGYVLRTGP